MSDFLGIDGCRFGWFVVILGRDESARFDLVSDASLLGAYIEDAEIALIDIPIGLRDGGPNERACDLQARRLLRGGRASSVFPVPCREAVYAIDYEEANRLNRIRTGRGLSKQSWYITPKIREIDQLLRQYPHFMGKCRESHPELCFRALNNAMAMNKSKKTREGQAQRLDVLRHYLPDVTSDYREIAALYPRKSLALDDISDAMVLAVSARIGKLATVPELPEKDGQGLAMEIAYPQV